MLHSLKFREVLLLDWTAITVTIEEYPVQMPLYQGMG